MKISLTSLDIAALTAELNQRLQGSRLNNVYYLPENQVYLFRIRSYGENLTLIIKIGEHLHLTQYHWVAPKIPTKKLMMFRKHIKGAVIESIQQFHFDRLVQINLKRGDETSYIVIELFGKGNLTYIGPDDKIKFSEVYLKMTDRNILPGKPYSYPPARGENPETITEEQLHLLLTAHKGPIEQVLSQHLNISPLFTKEILNQVDIPLNTISTTLSPTVHSAIFHHLREFISKARQSDLNPRIYRQNNEIVDVVPFSLIIYTNPDIIETPFESFNQAVDEAYTPSELTQVQETIKESSDQTSRKTEKMIQKQETQIKKMQENSKKYARWGEMIFSALHHLNSIYHVIQEAKNKKFSWDEILERLDAGRKQGVPELQIFHGVNLKNGELIIELEQEEITLDLQKNPSDNAQAFYVQSKKLAKKVKGARLALEKAQERAKQKSLTEDSSLSLEDGMPLTIARKQRKRTWYMKFRWFISSENVLVVAGRDLKSNELLYSKYLEPTDLFLHADIKGAPIIIVKNGQQEGTEQTIKEAAQFGVSYSKGWKRNIGSLDIYYVTPDQVSKSPQSGEYLSKGSYIITGKRTYLKNIPLRLAIGLHKDDQGIFYIVGPLSAVSQKTPYFVELIPGSINTHKIALQIQNHLLKSTPQEWTVEIRSIALSELEPLIPSGGGSLPAA